MRKGILFLPAFFAVAAFLSCSDESSTSSTTAAIDSGISAESSSSILPVDLSIDESSSSNNAGILNPGYFYSSSSDGRSDEEIMDSLLKLLQQQTSSGSEIHFVIPADTSSSSSTAMSSSQEEESSSSCVTSVSSTRGSTYNAQKNTLLDLRDNNTYRTVVIGTQTWMAENLNYSDSITTPSLLGSTRCYNNSVDSCAKYGRMYTWAAALDSVTLASTCDPLYCGYGKVCTLTTTVQGVCPKGWHLPTIAEWYTLFIAVGGADVAGTALKSVDGWLTIHQGVNLNTDEYGFTIITPTHNSTMFWTATQADADEDVNAVAVGFVYNFENASTPGVGKDGTEYIRCLMD